MDKNDLIILFLNLKEEWFLKTDENYLVENFYHEKIDHYLFNTHSFRFMCKFSPHH